MDNGRKARLTLAELALFGVLGALTFGAKFAMAALPNIEPVSLLVMLFAVTFGWKALYPVCVYVLLEFLVFGVSLWSIPYLYVWPLLAAAACLLREMTHPLAWALVSGAFGLCFGALCALIYLFMGGVTAAIAWWIEGIPFDLLHCAGNFVLTLVLFCPLRRLLERLYAAMRRRVE